MSPLFRLFFQDKPLFHNWQANRDSKLSRNFRTPEKDHLHIYSLCFSVLCWFELAQTIKCDKSLVYFYLQGSFLIEIVERVIYIIIEISAVEDCKLVTERFERIASVRANVKQYDSRRVAPATLRPVHGHEVRAQPPKLVRRASLDRPADRLSGLLPGRVLCVVGHGGCVFLLRPQGTGF